MTDLQTFTNTEFGEIRVFKKGDELWFVAADICDILKHTNVTVALQMLDDDERAKQSLGQVSSNGVIQDRETNMISESGLYQLVIRSNLPAAKTFRRWITHDVIPTIRKTGGYVADEEKFSENYLSGVNDAVKVAFRDSVLAFKSSLAALRASSATVNELTAKIEADKDKVAYAEAISVSENSLPIGEYAKLLAQNGIEIGQQRLFAFLRRNWYLGNRGKKHNLPTQKSIEAGLFEVKHCHGFAGSSAISYLQTQITAKGQREICLALKSAMASEKEKSLNLLAATMKELGMSEYQLTKKTGLGSSTIHRAMRCLGELNPGTKKKICRALGKTIPAVFPRKRKGVAMPQGEEE